MGTIEVARRGFNLNTAQDADKLFSSKFPSLLIYKRYFLTVSLTGATTFVPKKIAHHGLGYIPMFWAFKSNDNDEFKFSRVVLLDENDIYVMETGEAATTYHILLYVFFLPLFEDLTAPAIAATEQGKAQTKGPAMTIARKGHGVDEEDLRNFVIHPESKTLTVHMVKTANYPKDVTMTSAPVGTISVNHDLGYQPLHFLYLKEASGDMAGKAQSLYFLPNTDSNYSPTVKDRDFTYGVNTAGDYSAVIMKDPI